MFTEHNRPKCDSIHEGVPERTAPSGRRGLFGERLMLLKYFEGGVVFCFFFLCSLPILADLQGTGGEYPI